MAVRPVQPSKALGPMRTSDVACVRSMSVSWVLPLKALAPMVVTAYSVPPALLTFAGTVYVACVLSVGVMVTASVLTVTFQAPSAETKFT